MAIGIIRFTTETGSVYEVKPYANKARRIVGAKPPTARFGEDFEWHTYTAMGVPPTEVEIGEPLIFHWERDPRPDEIRLKHNTLTSPVVKIEYL